MQKNTKRPSNKNRKGSRDYDTQYFNRAFAHCSSEACEDKLTIKIRRIGYNKQMEIWPDLTTETKKKIARASLRLGYD